VLVADGGAVVGQAYLTRNRMFPGDVWILDCFVHPSFYDDAGVLLEALTLRDTGKVQCFVDSTQPEKAELLRERGLEQEATLRRQAMRDDRWLDIDVYAAPSQ
jgi:hypothetical protein